MMMLIKPSFSRQYTRSEKERDEGKGKEVQGEENSRGKNETSCNLSVSLVKGTVGWCSCIFSSSVVVYDRTL